MVAFKHSELVDKYHVSPSTIHNWIEAAKEGKLALKLERVGYYTRIANTQENITLLESLSDRARKYRNDEYSKVVAARPEFYDIYTKRQILDIITNLSLNKEIPLQYSYMDEGARVWSMRMDRLEEERQSNGLKNAIELIGDSLSAVDRYIQGKEKVNVIDLGIGNARPIKELVQHLLDRGVLHRLIGIDISPTMLDIAEENVKKWFGGRVALEKYVRDITSDKFDDLVIDDMLDERSKSTMNIVTMLGGTSSNFASPGESLQPIRKSLHNDDIFIHSFKPDSEASRHYFFGIGESDDILNSFIYVPYLMGIEREFFDIEKGFDQDNKKRYVRLRLNCTLTIGFDLGGTQRRQVKFNKGDVILILRAWHLSVPNMITLLGEAGLTLLYSSLTSDRQYFLSITGVDDKRGNEG